MKGQNHYSQSEFRSEQEQDYYMGNPLDIYSTKPSSNQNDSSFNFSSGEMDEEYNDNIMRDQSEECKKRTSPSESSGEQFNSDQESYDKKRSRSNFMEDCSDQILPIKVSAARQRSLYDLFDKYNFSSLDFQCIDEIAKRSKLSLETVTYYQKIYLKKQSLQLKHGQQKRTQNGVYKKTEIFDQAIKKGLKDTPFACINDLKKNIQEKQQLKLAKQTLIRRLKSLGYKYQRYMIKKLVRNEEKDKKMRLFYLKVLKDIADKNQEVFYYGYCQFALDEFKGNMWMKVDANGEAQNIKNSEELVTLIIILSSTKIQHFELYKGPYIYEHYLENLKTFVGKLRQNRQEALKLQSNLSSISKRQKFRSKEQYLKHIHLAMETISIHCNVKDVKCYDKNILGSQNVMKILIPSHSPQLSPVESVFNYIKYAIRESKPKNKEDIMKAIRKYVVENIDTNDISSAYIQAQKAQTRASQKLDL